MVERVERVVAASVLIEREVTALGIAVEQEVASVVRRRRHLVHHSVDGDLRIACRGNGIVGVCRVSRLTVEEVAARSESRHGHYHYRNGTFIYIHFFVLCFVLTKEYLA
jgi:hypothetical protein